MRLVGQVNFQYQCSDIRKELAKGDELTLYDMDFAMVFAIVMLENITWALVWTKS